MISHQSRMWELYDFRGHRVMVAQQWHDPFGKPMVHVVAVGGHDDRAEGMIESLFLSEAQWAGGSALNLASP